MSNYITDIFFFLEWHDERIKLKRISVTFENWVLYNKSKPRDSLLSFNSVPTLFRTLVKKYIERRILVQESLSRGSAIQNIAKLPVFFNFIHKRYPDWSKLTILSRIDIEDFIQYLRIYPIGGNSNQKNTAPSDNYSNRSISFLATGLISPL